MPKKKTRKQAMKEITRLEKDIYNSKKKLNKLRMAAPLEEVEDYEFRAPKGKKVKLSQLFGKKTDLIIVHNMGKRCPYCTLWADGFNGQLGHFEDRAAFAVISPDTPAVQQKFAKSRKWKFKMYSDSKNIFTEAMGYYKEPYQMPGISTFCKDEDGKIYRVATTMFGPGDDFCPVFASFEMLKGGVGEWWPKYKYKK